MSGEVVPYCLSSVQHFQSKNLPKGKGINSSTSMHNQEKLTQLKEDTLRSVMEEHQRPGNMKKGEESAEHRQRADA